MPSLLYLQPAALAAHDPREFDRAIATLLLGPDPVSVAVTGEQPGPTPSPASTGPVVDHRAGYHPAVQQQPNPATEATPPPRVLIADDAPAMRAALRGLLPMFVDRSVRIDRRDANAALGLDREEIEANNFAAALLMPQEMILAAVTQLSPHRGATGTEETIRRLANRFDVSPQAMEYRLANLGLIVPPQ